MSSEGLSKEGLRNELAELKDLEPRKFSRFTDNFFLIKAAVRYFGEKQGLSFTSGKVSENFPLAATTAGTCLNVLEELGAVKQRNKASSSKRYMPRDVDMDRIYMIEKVLEESLEITR